MAALQGETTEKISTAIDDQADTESNNKNVKVGVDEALQYAASERIAIDDATNSRLLRTTDLHILPWLCALYFMQYLDKGM